jgi:hypothetical protein
MSSKGNLKIWTKPYWSIKKDKRQTYNVHKTTKE